MNKVIKVIDDAESVDAVFSSDCFDCDSDSLVRVISGPVYGRSFARYILLKLDFLFTDPGQRMQFETLSVEHVLPQNPAQDSQWVKDFTPQEQSEWTDKLGNLVLITRRKNSSQGRLDYSVKKERYFEKWINTCPNSLRVLRNEKWTLTELKANHEIVLRKLWDHYSVSGVVTPAMDGAGSAGSEAARRQ